MPEKIETLQRIMELAKEKRSIFCPSMGDGWKRKPAAFVINMAGSVILRMIESGLYVYEKGGKNATL